ncbi:hypothetical protein EVAR_32181_1 [Eumeta japonica]|uniref:Uncharacterized protein n=1 Tax=Eumeta variegata TaxID=151549 RepID=A0A4C1W0M2_EUMVA|nr:hypothetical protein EVAR_32181_1 [Eumeta japonica]
MTSRTATGSETNWHRNQNEDHNRERHRSPLVGAARCGVRPALPGARKHAVKQVGARPDPRALPVDKFDSLLLLLLHV